MSAALRFLLVAGRCCGLGCWLGLIFRQFLYYFADSVDFCSPFGLYYTWLVKASAELNSQLSILGLSKGGEIMRTTYATRAQLGHVLAALMPENRLIMELCMATGLRVSDVLELRTADLRRRQTVRQRKG